MMQGISAKGLGDGERLHLQHGPIDLIIGASENARDACFHAATKRFETILTGLVAELPLLRRPICRKINCSDPTAQRMILAVSPYQNTFVTPMAAVAGAVADEVLAAMIKDRHVDKAYVNNGGDIAFHLSDGEQIRALSVAGEVTITAASGIGGLATSGWRGRSFSLGIADSVTVAAASAAAADVAATLIANAIDLPGHPAVARLPACELSPDSDLGALPVTVDVGALTPAESAAALDRGQSCAENLIARGLVAEATLTLCGETRHVASRCTALENGVPAHA